MPVYKYTLKDGKTVRWFTIFYHVDWTGKRIRVCKRGFATQREAKEYERHYLEREAKPTCDISFEALVENYIDDMSHRLKPTTMNNKVYMIKDKILPYFAKLKINEIDTIKIRKWQNVMLSYSNAEGKGYSQTYLKTLHNQLSAIFNYAVAHYNLPSNPCRIAGSIGSKRADEMNIWTQEEYERFSSVIKKSAVKLAFDILFYTGMRIGEVLALTPADIKPNKRIDINKNFAVVDGEELFLTPKTPKSKRTIAIPDFLYDEIQDYISKLYEPDEDEMIFYFGKSLLEREIKVYAKKADLKPIRVHDLRHSHASMLINMNFGPLEISERLGHESVKTTLDIYSHLYPDKDQKLADALNNLRGN